MNQVANDLIEVARRDFPKAELLLVFLPEGGPAIACRVEDVEAFGQFEFLGVALLTRLEGDAVDLKCLTPRTDPAEETSRHQMVRESAIAEWGLSRHSDASS